MDVIFTFFATTSPITAPSSRPAARITHVILSEASRILWSNKVKTTATSMPTDESILPLRAVSALPSILMPRIKITAETM